MKTSTRSSVILAVSFSAVITVAAYPLLSPLVEVVLSGAATGEALVSAFLRCAEVSEWPSFWTSGAWIAHLPYMLLALAAVFLVLLAYSATTARRGERAVEGGIYGEAHVMETEAELRARNDFWDGRGTPKSAG